MSLPSSLANTTNGTSPLSTPERKMATKQAAAPAYAPLVCHGHSRPIVEISYSPITPDGFFLISASKDGQPMLRNGETGDWIGTFQGHKGAVWSVCLDPPAMLAATASADFSARVWDALSGDEKHKFEHKHIVRTVDFSQDSHRILTGGAEKLMRVFDLQRPDAEPQVIAGSVGSVRCARWHDNDQLALTIISDMPGVMVWDLRSAQHVRTLPTDGPCSSIEVSRDGSTITTADGSIVKFFSAHSLEPLKSFTLPYKAESASLAPHINKFVAGGEDLWVRVFAYDTGEELECHRGHHGPVHTARIAPDSASYASGSEDGTIRIWKFAAAASEGGSDPVGAGGAEALTQGVAAMRVGADSVERVVEGFHVPAG